MSSETVLLEGIRYNNAVRAANAREYVGGLYFLVAVGMLVFGSFVSLVQAYCLPLRRFRKTLEWCGSVRSVALFYFLIINGLYFVVSIFGGMTGWIVMTGLYFLWLIALGIIGVCRRKMHKAKTKQDLKKAREDDDRDASNFKASESAAFDRRRSSVNFADNPNDTSHDFGAQRSSGDFGHQDSSGDFGNFNNQSSAVFGDDTGEFELREMKSQKSMKKVRPPRGSFSSPPPRTKSAFKAHSYTHNADSGEVHLSKSAEAKRKSEAGRVRPGDWTASPDALSTSQRTLMLLIVAFFLIVIAVIWVVLIAWRVKDYQYVSTDVTAESEPVNLETAQALQCMYAFPRIANGLQLDVYVKAFTEYCGSKYRKTLSDSQKDSEIRLKWIDTYGINMNQYLRRDYRNYTSVNDFITRPMNMTFRPQPPGVDEVVSPADARTLIYTVNEDVKFWLKGYFTSWGQILGHRIIGGTSRYYENGAAVISRLAPQDYHRFHAPVAGGIIDMYDIPGTLWSVGPDASGSGNEVFLNSRRVVVLDAGSRIGIVTVVAIGATCLGSIVWETSSGDELGVGSFVERGDQLGYIQFGGSTVVSFFRQNRVLFNENVLYRSRFPVETELYLNQEIGKVRP